ncbi:MAG TPA: hypothetical protein VEW08_14830 [Steroidobacteraceae bacterium]|nr:hypothetical protein [Steroidobacteraceae bacterium]
MLEIRHRAAFAALICACVLVACDDAPPEPQQGAPVVKKPDPPPKEASISKDMVAAVSGGKSASVISVHFALREPPTVNKALAVDVAIVPHRDFTSVSAHFDSQDGLTTTSGDFFGPKSDIDSETPLSHQLVLLPTREGMFMVTSSVDTVGVEGNITRIFSIPIIVAAAAAPAPAGASATQPAREPDKN